MGRAIAPRQNPPLTPTPSRFGGEYIGASVPPQKHWDPPEKYPYPIPPKKINPAISGVSGLSTSLIILINRIGDRLSLRPGGGWYNFINAGISVRAKANLILDELKIWKSRKNSPGGKSISHSSLHGQNGWVKPKLTPRCPPLPTEFNDTEHRYHNGDPHLHRPTPN